MPNIIFSVMQKPFIKGVRGLVGFYIPSRTIENERFEWELMSFG
jgi:hypothetical protein